MESIFFSQQHAHCSASFTHCEIDSSMSLIHGKYSYLTGVCSASDSVHLDIPIKTGSVMLNGIRIGGGADSLEVIATHSLKHGVFNIEEEYESIKLVIPLVLFTKIHQKISLKKDQNWTEQIASGTVKFKNTQVKSYFCEQCLSLIKRFGNTNLITDTPPPELSRRLLELFFTSLDDGQIDTYLPSSHMMALKAHNILISTTDTKLGTSDLCNMLNVNARTLQKGFSAIFGIGITEYHKLYRLHLIRTFIKKNVMNHGKLTDLVGMFGFNHLGRFSQEYKRIYGVLPSHDRKLLVAFKSNDVA